MTAKSIWFRKPIRVTVCEAILKIRQQQNDHGPGRSGKNTQERSRNV